MKVNLSSSGEFVYLFSPMTVPFNCHHCFDRLSRLSKGKLKNALMLLSVSIILS